MLPLYALGILMVDVAQNFDARKTAAGEAGIDVTLKAFPHPDLAFNQDAMKTYGGMFIFATLMFNFIIQLSHIVKEKELRLREAMKQMGLQTLPYWLSWFITNAVLDHS